MSALGQWEAKHSRMRRVLRVMTAATWSRLQHSVLILHQTVG